MTFVTLNTIVTDLLKIVRSSNISESEKISKRQLEDWVHQYRALLLSRDMDKNRVSNPDYIQELKTLTGLNYIQLEKIDSSDGGLSTGESILKTVQSIPKTIDLNYKSGLVSITTLTGDEIQLIPEGRQRLQKYKKYTSDAICTFLKSNYLYVIGTDVLNYIKIRGIFEVPTEADSSMTLDTPYPIPNNLLPALKEMILKNELGIEVKMPTDITNDSSANYKQMISQPQSQN